ncbi:MAG: amidohydrolase [Pseudomonadota bacterium]
MHRTAFASLIILAVILGTSCGKTDSTAVEFADIVFVGDHIVSVDPATENASGVAVRDEKIIEVGTRQAVEALVGPDTRLVELGSKALLPGFIDSHGHVSFAAAVVNMANLAPPPVGPVESMNDLLQALRDYANDPDNADRPWLVGFGYDDSLILEKRHPARRDLDEVSSTRPIFLLHVSGHLAATNSRGLEALNIDATSKDPEGGIIRREPKGQEPNGVLEETAAFGPMMQIMTPASPREFAENIRKALALYASHGITTAQDGAASPEAIQGFRALSAAAPFPIDVAAYRQAKSMAEDDYSNIKIDETYANGFRLAGVKFSLDGSPQGRTAWMSEPYQEGPPNSNPDYRAYPTVNPERYSGQAAILLNRGVPLLVHTNGDAAIDLLLDSVAAAFPESMPDHRTVAIHAQLMRDDQVDKAAQLGVIPSFFSAHSFFWGDWHQKSFGEQRGKNISPTGSALKADLLFTIHNDAPVVPPDMMRLLWATVNRQSRSGATIGEHQKISIADALAAATINGAYAYFEEDNKGSITKGKVADLIIVSANPLEVASSDIKDLKVLETFSHGRSVFLRETD